MDMPRVRGQSFELYTVLGTQQEGRSHYMVLQVGRSLADFQV